MTFTTYNTSYEKKGLEVLARIFGIITCQVNGNYRDGSRNNEFPTDKLEPNAQNALFQRKIDHA